MPRKTRRRRDQSRSPAALARAIEAGQPWERPESDLKIDLGLYQLLTGHDHFGRGFKTRKEQREAWEAVREPFLAAQIERRPGSRPWAWWEFDAPEPRRFEGHASPASVTWFGGPSAYSGELELEADYLARLKLLAKGEIPTRRDDTDPVTRYARDVIVSGDRVSGESREPPAGKPPTSPGRRRVCRETLWACQRHLRDLAEGWRRGLWLDRRAIDYRLTFSRYIRHYQGPKAGDVHRQEPWQEFRNGSIEGWRRSDGTRRFTNAWLEVGRGNGKTFMSAEDGLYALAFDGQAGAEVLCAATKRDQAAKCLTDAITIVRGNEQVPGSPLLNAIFKTTDPQTRAPRVIYHPASSSIMRTITSAANTEDSHNCSKALLDEVHAYKDSTVWDILRGAVGKRGDGGGSISGITTAGFDAEGFGGSQHDLYRKVLDPEEDYDSDSIFALIYTLDDEEEWKDPAAWIKANPNLGVSVSERDLSDHCAEARLDSSKVNDLLVKRFCVWTTTAETWLPWEMTLDDGRQTGWKHCTTAAEPVAWRREMLERLRGERVLLGVDMGEKLDPAALLALFPDVQPLPVVIPWFWVPADGLRKRGDRDRFPYDVHVARGLVETCPGVEVDDVLIERQIDWVAERYDLRDITLASGKRHSGIGYDPWHLKDMTKRMTARGFNPLPVRQGFATMSEPLKQIAAWVHGGRFDHGSHPMLGWNARNATVRSDPNGNLALDKGRQQRKRIDGLAAFGIAMRVYLEDQEQRSAYQEEGVSFI